jgi:hypothetical protein
MRSNERGLSDADQSSGKKRPNSAMDSTDGAEEPGGAMADIKRADHEVLLSRIRLEKAALRMAVCPVSWRNGTAVLYFANRKGHVDLDTVLSNCAAAGNEITLAQ